jgi:hypothetical protein
MAQKPPALSGTPVYRATSQTIHFTFWKGNVRQAGEFEVPDMTAEAAVDHFMTNWAEIGLLAAKTVPTNSVVKLRFLSRGYS